MIWSCNDEHDHIIHAKSAMDEKDSVIVGARQNI